MSRTDTATRIALQVTTGLTVAGLAGVAGAISFSHMAALALAHDQLGWKSTAFPISVDGLELTASLFLVAQHRAGRRVGVLPWAALLVGTAASLAANVAVGGHDLVGRALAGWPAISLLVSVKLLFSMIDYDAGDQRTAVQDDQRTAPTVRDVPGTVQRTGRDERQPSGTVPGASADRRDLYATGPADRPVLGTAGKWAAPGAPAQPARRGTTGRGDPVTGVDRRSVAHLIPAARSARATLARDGRSLSRDNLADAMREGGNGVSSTRASLLLKILRAESGVITIGSEGPSGLVPEESEPLSEDVA
jgi:hypothetical protein